MARRLTTAQWVLVAVTLISMLLATGIGLYIGGELEVELPETKLYGNP